MHRPHTRHYCFPDLAALFLLHTGKIFLFPPLPSLGETTFLSFSFLHSGNSLFFSLPPTLQSAHVSDLKSEIGTALRHHSTGNSSNCNGSFNSQQAGGASAAGEHQPNEWRKATSTQDCRCRLDGAAALLGPAPLRTHGRSSEVNRNRRLTGPPERPASSHPEAPAKTGWN